MRTWIFLHPRHCIHVPANSRTFGWNFQDSAGQNHYSRLSKTGNFTKKRALSRMHGNPECQFAKHLLNNILRGACYEQGRSKSHVLKPDLNSVLLTVDADEWKSRGLNREVHIRGTIISTWSADWSQARAPTECTGTRMPQNTIVECTLALLGQNGTRHYGTGICCRLAGTMCDCLNKNCLPHPHSWHNWI